MQLTMAHNCEREGERNWVQSYCWLKFCMIEQYSVCCFSGWHCIAHASKEHHDHDDVPLLKRSISISVKLIMLKAAIAGKDQLNWSNWRQWSWGWNSFADITRYRLQSPPSTWPRNGWAAWLYCWHYNVSSEGFCQGSWGPNLPKQQQL